MTRRTPNKIDTGPRSYWIHEPNELFGMLDTTSHGLSSVEAAARLQQYGANAIDAHRRFSGFDVFVRQFRSPLLALLIFAAATSAVTGQWADAGIVLVIVLATVGVGGWREYGAETAAEALRARVRTRTTVLRDGQPTVLPHEEIVPGDVVLLTAGSLVPADIVLLEAEHCFVGEAVLTGESFPVQKRPGVVELWRPLVGRTNCLYLGTNVRSGSARGLVVRTGLATEFGAIARRLTLRPPETEFDQGIRRFGYLLLSAMSVMVLGVFAVHVLQGRPPIETLLFAVALAVGLSPELLPAILGVNLARGATGMAAGGVLVRRLSAIENLGSMDILCTDKTGTLTEGVVELDGAWDATGARSDAVLRLAAVNAALETGIDSPLDAAILRASTPDLAGIEKLGEIPFDFLRKQVTVVIQQPEGPQLITKGAFHHVLDDCTQDADGTPLSGPRAAERELQYEAWSSRGVRVLAVATRAIDRRQEYTREDETNLTFAGFLTFLDRPREGVQQALGDLAARGVSVKLITGDNRLVATHIATLVGLPKERVLSGQALDELHDEALWRAAEETDLFVEVDPNQKERIILSLKKMGHVVGFLGDGVNDAPAMHAADTSLSVESAVDVARDAADFVLVERGLHVILRGIDEGRRTFANTLKYVLITTSANLGNMVSMAAASLLLPFLPLTAGQILLNNFLSDIPAVGLASDRVDPELVERPRRWDLRFIRRYMVEFGLLSSVFDVMTFGLLIVVFHAGPDAFRTAWFVESLLTELVIALVVRTRGPFFRSRPGTLLVATTALITAVAFAIPYLPFAGLLGFVPLPLSLVATIAGIAALYVVSTELLKWWFYREGPEPSSHRPSG